MSNQDPCDIFLQVGGKDSIESNARILKELMDKDNYEDISSFVDQKVEFLKTQRVGLTEENAPEYFSNAIAKAQQLGLDVRVYDELINSVDFKKNAKDKADGSRIIEIVEDFLVRQSVIMSGLEQSAMRQISDSSKLTKLINEGGDTLAAELTLGESVAKTELFMALNSLTGTGASRMLSARKSGNLTGDILDPTWQKKFVEEKLQSNNYLHKNKRNLNDKTRLQNEQKALEKDLGAAETTPESLQDTLKINNQRVEELQAEKELLDAQIRRRKETLGDDAKADQDPVLKTLKEESEAVAEDVKEIKNINKLQEENLNDATPVTKKQQKQATEQVKQKEKQLSPASKEVKKLEGEIKKTEGKTKKEVSELKKELEKAKKAQTPLSKEFNKLKSAITRLKANPSAKTLTALRAAVKTAAKDQTLESKEFAKLKLKLVNLKKTPSQADIDALKVELKTATKNRTDLSKQAESLNNQITNAARKVDEGEVKALQDKLKKAKEKETPEGVKLRKELNNLKSQIARAEKGPPTPEEIAKNKERLRKAKEARLKKAKEKIKASDITTKRLHDQFVNQTLGTSSARTYAKRLLVASKSQTPTEAAYQVKKISEQTGFNKGLNVGLQWFMGSILSGPPTLVINGVSGLAANMVLRLEQAVGAAVLGNGDLLKASFSMHNTFSSLVKAMKMGIAALKADEDTFTRTSRAFDDNMIAKGALDPANFDNPLTDIEPMGAIMQFFNFATRLPLRINGSIDVMNKVFAADKYLNDHYMLEGYSLIKQNKLTTEELPAYVQKMVQKMYNEDGSLFSEKRMVDWATRKTSKEGYNYEDGINFASKRAEFMQQRLDEVGGDFSAMDTLGRNAEKFARESTFTGEAGDITRLVNEGLHQLPVLKLVIPFVNTPMEILNFGWRRTAIGAAMEGLSPLISKKARKRRAEFNDLPEIEKARVAGRYTTAMTTSASLLYFFEGHGEMITGGGPRNPQERKALMATGWQPYSFRVKGDDGTETYVSYQRLDPFTTMIGIIADIAEYTSLNPHDSEAPKQSLLALSFTIAENMTDKSFLKGLNSIINIGSDPEYHASKALKDIVSGGAVPMFLDKMKNIEGEKMIRENRTIVDSILRKLPILEDQVPPKRTFLGEAIYKQNPAGLLGPLNPIYISSGKNDIVDAEVRKMVHGFSLPPLKYTNHESTDMTQFVNKDGRQAYDRFLELTSEIELRGLNLRDSLKRLFKSSYYKKVAANYEAALKDGLQGAEDPRVRLAQQTIGHFRAIAKRRLLYEFPELDQTVRAVKQQRAQLRTGRAANPIPQL